MLITLLSQTGLRASEACALLLSDIDLEKRYLTVRLAKWGKTRKVGLTAQVIGAIERCLDARSDAQPHEPLLLNRKGGPMDRSGLRQRIERIGLKAGIEVHLELSQDIRRFVEQALEKIRCREVTADIALESNFLPGDFHGDPGDRMIVATARTLGASLVTADEKILAYAQQGHINILALSYKK